MPNETFHDAETMPDEAHAPMPPSPLSPRRACASGPNSSSTHALVAEVTTLTAATIAQSSLFAHTPTLRLGRQHTVPFVLIATDCQYERYRTCR